MSNIIELDKQNHEKEFRFRLLITDACNLYCSYCLNDFMPKSKNIFGYADIELFKNAFLKYVHLCKRNHIIPILTIAGGEPGLHPNLGEFIKIAHYFYDRYCINGKIILVTNGTAFGQYNISINPEQITKTHVHIPINQNNLKRFKIIEKNIEYIGCIQTVFNKDYNNLFLYELLSFCKLNKIPLKLFSDFNDESSNNLLETYISNNIKNKDFISTRFTGKQTNRGILCDKCVKKCITLKAIWMNPYNQLYPCPQTDKLKINASNVTNEYVEKLHNLHKKED